MINGFPDEIVDKLLKEIDDRRAQNPKNAEIAKERVDIEMPTIDATQVQLLQEVESDSFPWAPSWVDPQQTYYNFPGQHYDATADSLGQSLPGFPTQPNNLFHQPQAAVPRDHGLGFQSLPVNYGIDAFDSNSNSMDPAAQQNQIPNQIPQGGPVMSSSGFPTQPKMAPQHIPAPQVPLVWLHQLIFRWHFSSLNLRFTKIIWLVHVTGNRETR